MERPSEGHEAEVLACSVLVELRVCVLKFRVHATYIPLDILQLEQMPLVLHQ